MTLGLASIVYSVNGRVSDACWLILLSVMLDKLDGSLARALGAESPVGVELDSFADFVAFGVAPASILVGIEGGAPITFSWYFIFAWLYIVCCVLRLARFNVETESPHKGIFHGVPSTLAGAVVGTTVLVALEQGIESGLLAVSLGCLLGALGVLMLSPVYIPKVGRSRKRSAQLFTVLNLLLVLVLVLIRRWPLYLCCVAFSYLFIGAIVGGFQVRGARQPAP